MRLSDPHRTITPAQRHRRYLLRRRRTTSNRSHRKQDHTAADARRKNGPTQQLADLLSSSWDNSSTNPPPPPPHCSHFPGGDGNDHGILDGGVDICLDYAGTLRVAPTTTARRPTTLAVPTPWWCAPRSPPGARSRFCRGADEQGGRQRRHDGHTTPLATP